MSQSKRGNERLKHLCEMQQRLIEDVRTTVSQRPFVVVRARTLLYNVPTYRRRRLEVKYVTTHLVVGVDTESNMVQNIQLVDFLTGEARILEEDN